MSGLVRILLGLVVLVSLPGAAGATMLWNSGGGGTSITPNSCDPGDFATGIDGTGTLTCDTPAGSGDITAVGDCTSGACFDGTSGTTLTGTGDSTLLLLGGGNVVVEVDSDNDGANQGFVVRNSADESLFEVNENSNAYLYNNMALRFREATANGSSAVIVTGPASMTTSPTIVWPEASGTVAVSATAPVTLSAAGAIGVTQNAGTDITADLEEETHATEHSLGGTDAITVTNLASACSDAQVLGGTAGGTGVECQADVDTNANTICSGTTTYLDGEGNCDDIAAVYAPIGATFITQTASAALTGEQAMGALGTGLVLNTTTTGVQSIYTGTSCTNQFPRSLNASGAATCASVVSADITDGTIAAGDIADDAVTEAKLKSVNGPTDEYILTYESTTGDFEWQNSIAATVTGASSLNTLLAGRAGTGNDTIISTNGAGTIYGSGTTANDLTLRANDDDTTTGEINLNAPVVELYPSLPAATSAAQLLLKALPTTTLQTNDECTSASTPYACCSGTKTGTCAGAYTMVDSSPVLSSTDFASISHFRAGGSVARTGTTGGTLYSVLGFQNDVTFTSATSGGPLFQDAFFDSSRAEQTANTATQNTWVPISFLSKPELAATGTASLTVGSMYGVHMDPGFEEISGATLALTDYAAVNVADPRETSASSGTPAITNYMGVRIEDLSDAMVTNPISVLSEGTTTEMRHAGPARFGATGAVTSGKVLDAQGDAFINGYLDLGDGIADPGAASTTSAIDISGSIDLPNSTGNFVGLKISPASAQSESNNLVGIDFSPTITQSGAVEVPTVYGLNTDGTSTVTGTTTFTSNALLRHNRTYTTATVDADPASTVIALSNTPGLSVSSASGTSSTNTLGAVLHSPQVTNSGGATYTVAVDYGLRMLGTYTESSGNLIVTDRVGLDFDDVTNTSSATAITRNIGVDIAALSTATTNIGIRNADTTVYTPCSQTSLGSGFTISPDCTVIEIGTSGNFNYTSSTSTGITAGVAGQILTLINVDSNSNTITMDNTGGTIELNGAADYAMGLNDTLTLVYSSTRSLWLETARSDN